MFCATCGTLMPKNLNYCNRCGARVDKLAVTGKKEVSAVGALSIMTGFVGLGGLGLTLGLIALLLKSALVPEAVVMLALAFLLTTLGLTFMMIRQVSRMTGSAPSLSENTFSIPQLNKPDTAQLEEPRQPATSVTENTTRTLEKELIR